MYPDGGSGGASATVTLGTVLTVSGGCGSAGTGYTTLPTSVLIGQSSTGTMQLPVCSTSVNFIITPVPNSGSVTVSAVGTASGCLGGTYNLLFIGGSGTLMPGSCMLSLSTGVHAAFVSLTGGGYGSTPSVVFPTGAQAPGCQIVSIGGFIPASGAIPGGAGVPTTSTVTGCLIGSSAPVFFPAPTVTPATGTYIIPGHPPQYTGISFLSDTGSLYTVDLSHVTVTTLPTLTASCDISITATAGTNPGKLKITLAGTSWNSGVGCVPGTYTVNYGYSGVLFPNLVNAPTPPGASSISIPAPTTVTYSGSCTSFAPSCTTSVGTSTSLLDTVTITIAPASINSVSVSFPSGCISFSAHNDFGTTNTFTLFIVGGAPNLANCIIGLTWTVTLSFSNSPTANFTIAINTVTPSANGALSGGAVIDNLGADYTVLPSISLGPETSYGFTQPSTCDLRLRATLGTTAGAIQVINDGGNSSGGGLGCLVGIYSIVFTQRSGGLGVPPGSSGTITFSSGSISVALSSSGANYPARPRVMMGGQPNSCLATTDSSLIFTASTGALSGVTATFGGTLAGCLIFSPSIARSLDISAGQMEPAAGYYTISGGLLSSIMVNAPGFGYTSFPSPVLAPTGTDGQSASCTLTALIPTASTLTSTGVTAGSAIAPANLNPSSSLPLSLSNCNNGSYSIVFTKPKTFSLPITADTPFSAGSLLYNDLLLLGLEVVRIAGACSLTTPPVCPVIRGQQFTKPIQHSSTAKMVLLRRSPAPQATPAVSFSLSAASLSGSSTLALTSTGNTWFPSSSISIGDQLLVRTVIVQCTATSCGTIARAIGGTVDVDFSSGDTAWLLPATSITFTLTWTLGIIGDGYLDTLSMTSNQPTWPTLTSGDMLLINSEVVQVSVDCSASPCTIARAKGGTAMATASIGDRAVLVRRANGYSLMGPITFTVSNALGLGVSDSTVTLAEATDFAVTSLAANDVLIVGAEFLKVSGACYGLTGAKVCPVFRGQKYGAYNGAAGYGGAAASAIQGSIVTLVRRPSFPPPAASEVIFSVAASFSAWGMIGLGYCPGPALSGCGNAAGCKGTCPSTPVFGQTLLSLTTDGPYPATMLGEHELLMLGTELVRLVGPCHTYGCPVLRAQQYSEYTTQSLNINNRQARAILVKASAITFTLSSSLAAGVKSVSLAADTAVNVASLAPNTVLLIGTEVVRITSVGCTSLVCNVDRGQLTPTGQASADPGTTYPVGTKLTLLDQALQRGYSAATGVQLNLAYMPQPSTVTSKAYSSGTGVATYSIDRCDPTSVPASREAPIQIILGNEYLKAPGSNYGTSYTYDTQSSGNAFWVDGGTATSFTSSGHGAAAGGSIIEIKGWDLLPSDMDLAYDGAVTFTLYSAASAVAAAFSLTSRIESFPVQSLVIGDFLFIGTEIIQVTGAASPGTSLATAAAITVTRGMMSSIAAAYPVGTKAMLMSRPINGLSPGLKVFTIVSVGADITSITFTSGGTLRKGDLLLAPGIGEIIQITSASCVTACSVARGQPSPLGQQTASAQTGVGLIFIKRPATVAPGPISFTLATMPLLAADTTITLTAAADPITFTVVSGPNGFAAATAADTYLVLRADTSFAVTSLVAGDMLLVGSEVIVVLTAASASRPTLITVSRGQSDVNLVPTSQAVIPVYSEALLLDSLFRPRRLLGIPRPGFLVGSLAEGDVLSVGGEMLRVMGPCGLNGASQAPDAMDVCPVQRAYLGTTSPASVPAGPTVSVLLMQRSTTDGSKVSRASNYILVTVGQRPPECANAWASAPCTPGRTSAQEQRLACAVREVRQGFCANDRARACRCRDGVMCPDCPSNAVCRNGISTGTDHTWPYRTKPALRCVLPPMLGPDQNLNIYLHGIKTTLTDWYHPDPPVVTGLSPVSVSYLGGDFVTVFGRNFGPAVSWTRTTAGGAQTLKKWKARVELLGRAVVLACDTTYVSDSQLLCKVPALPQQRQPVDAHARTVAVDMVVSVMGRRSARVPQANLKYSQVPAFYMCPNVGVSAQTRADCYSCCSSACTVDQFAQGTDTAMAAPTFCGASCSNYCGGGAAAWVAGGRPRGS